MKAQLRIKVVAAAAALSVIALACGGSESPNTTADTNTPSVAPTTQPPQTTVAPNEPPVSVEVPAAYIEVAAEYEAAESAIFAAGRAIVDEFLDGNVAAVHSRFVPAFAAQISSADMLAIHAELSVQAPFGDVRNDRALPMGSTRAYAADLDWGTGAMALMVTFDEADEVTGFLLNPRQELPIDPAAEVNSSVQYRLPFDGLWFVGWGGDTELDNYHVVAPDQRHAYDILVWRDGSTHRGDGTSNDDYWAYGQPVLAPAAGTVTSVVDGHPDQTPQQGSDAGNPAGNHVVIEVADGEYVVIAHLQPGSITVAEGDTVASGQQIALVGNSGNTSEPHIHIHAQDRPVFGPFATGLPLAFIDYRANGEAVDIGVPLGGQFVVPVAGA